MQKFSTTTAPRVFIAELIGVTIFCAAAVGSGATAFQLSGGIDGVAMIAHSLAVAGAYWGAAAMTRPFSGGWLNPAASLAQILSKRVSLALGAVLISAQILGAFLGVMLANLAHDYPLLGAPLRPGGDLPQALLEGAASLAVCAIALSYQRNAAQTAGAIAAFSFAALWVAAFAAYANPALTLARAFTDGWIGLSLNSALILIGVQMLGGAMAAAIYDWLLAPEG